MIDQNGAIALAFEHRPIGHAEDAGCGMLRDRAVADKGDEQIDTGWTGEGSREGCASGATSDEAKLLLYVSQALCAPRPGFGDGSQTFSENALRTLRYGAEEATDAQINLDGNVRPRQISQGPMIVAVNAGRGLGAGGAQRSWAGR